MSSEDERPGESASRDLGVVTVSYRSAAEVEGLARSLPATLSGRLAVFCVVDNSQAPEDFGAVAQALAPSGTPLTVLRPGSNVGFGAANNLGLRHADSLGCRAVWFLNPDSRVVRADPHAVDRALDTRPHTVVFATGLATGSGERPGVSVLSTWSGRVLPAGRASAAIAFVNGNSMLARVRGLLELGGFDERFFLYFEEADLAVRCAAARHEPAVVDELVVSHVGGTSTGSRRGVKRSEIAVFHAHRSSVLFFAKHLPRRLVPLLIARAVNCVRLAVREPRLGWAAARGTAAGLRFAVLAARGARMGT